MFSYLLEALVDYFEQKAKAREALRELTKNGLHCSLLEGRRCEREKQYRRMEVYRP